MSNSFKSLGKAFIGITVGIPVAIISDVITLGGALTDEQRPYTGQVAKKIVKNIDDAIKPEHEP